MIQRSHLRVVWRGLLANKYRRARAGSLRFVSSTEKEFVRSATIIGYVLSYRRLAALDTVAALLATEG